MLIRSSNKEVLVHIERYIIGVSSKKDIELIVAQCEMNSSFTLGEYSTKEKAIKVLDDIQEMYKNYTRRYGGDHAEDAVFQMPLDEEVTDASTEANEQEK